MSMMRVLSLSLLTLVFSAPALAFEPHAYTYVEARYFDGEWERDVRLPNTDIEGDGWMLSGSYRTEGGVLFQAHYAEGDLDKAWGQNLSRTPGISADTRSMGLLFGGANQVNERASVSAGIGYAREEIKWKESGEGTDTLRADVYTVAIGGRYWLVQRVEVNAGARFLHMRPKELGGTDNDVAAAIGLRFQPAAMFSIGAGVERFLDAGTDVLSADLRFQF